MLAKKQVFWRLMLFYSHLLLLLQPSVLWLSIVTFNNDKSHRPSEFCANLMYHYSDPGGGYPTLRPQLEGYPVWQTELPVTLPT